MNRLSLLTGVLACLMVLLAALGAVCGAVDQIATDAQFYSGMSRAAVAKHLNVENDPQADEKVTEYIGMDNAAQTAFAGEMAAFMRGEAERQPDILSADEQQHMRDVRGLTQRAAQLSKTLMTFAAVLAVVIAWTGAKLKRRLLPEAIGGLSALTLLAVLAYGVISRMNAGGFADMFVKMHEMLFTNDLWLMDPQTDILIRMMPQPLFEQALVHGAGLALRLFVIVCVMLLAVQFIVGRMIRTHVTREDK